MSDYELKDAELLSNSASFFWWWRESVDPIPEGTGFVIRNQVLLLKDCAVLHRVAVFFYRKGRRGFA
ncbi:MAG: hypothetical protein LBD35_08055, partial [Prevotellaceae bacterium]|nr:hypothetical protein [Prevotellaceae bacterium]